MADDYTTSNSTAQAAGAGVHEKVVTEEVNPHDYRCWEMFKAYRQCICELAIVRIHELACLSSPVSVYIL